MSKEYKLSACLYGHSLDVRSIYVTSNNDIISGSRDKTARYWKLNKLTSSYQEIMCYRDQKNFVGSVLYLEPSEEYPDGLIVTGGNDNLILIYKPSEPFTSFTFKEHTNAVCCLSKCNEPNSFLSSSWDTTAKYWNINSDKSIVTFTGHTASVWSVIQIADGRIITASADRTIGIWTNNGQKLNTLSGHTDCVRSLIDFPEMNGFLSASNDASIRLWSYSGENLNTFYGHSSFIYGLGRCSSSDDNLFVSSDENRSVKVWLNGENVQTITLPAQSVWTVACLSNGDIVTGSSDGLVRIFTQDENRVADEQTLTKFNEEVNAILQQSLQQIGGYKVSDLPGKEALYDPGKTAGQNKMVREGNNVVLYTWVDDGANSHWEKVGDVLGGTDKDDSGKTIYEGNAYDFVFSVDVEDGKPPLKLPFNKGDDPYQAAHKFLSKHLLPAEYLEQVVDFILKNSNEQFVPPSADYVDPFTGGARYTPNYGNTQGSSISGNADPFTGGSSYSTSASKTSSTSVSSKFFPITVYRTFEMGDPKVILNKLNEFNKRSSNLTDETELEDIVKICNSPVNDPKTVDLLFQLLDWPDDIVFPVLDIVRMAVRNKTNNDVVSNVNNGILMDKLLYYLLESKIDNNIIVSLRTICNLCVHESGENLVFNKRFELMENITASKLLNKSGQVALATVLLNLTILTVKRNDELGYSILAEVLPDILTKLTDIESQFRTYVALGTLITQANSHLQEVKLKINGNSNFLSTLQLHVLGSSNDLETKRMNCVKELQAIL